MYIYIYIYIYIYVHMYRERERERELGGRATHDPELRVQGLHRASAGGRLRELDR